MDGDKTDIQLLSPSPSPAVSDCFTTHKCSNRKSNARGNSSTMKTRYATANLWRPAMFAIGIAALSVYCNYSCKFSISCSLFSASFKGRKELLTKTNDPEMLYGLARRLPSSKPVTVEKALQNAEKLISDEKTQSQMISSLKFLAKDLRLWYMLVGVLTASFLMDLVSSIIPYSPFFFLSFLFNGFAFVFKTLLSLAHFIFAELLFMHYYLIPQKDQDAAANAIKLSTPSSNIVNSILNSFNFSIDKYLLTLNILPAVFFAFTTSSNGVLISGLYLLALSLFAGVASLLTSTFPLAESMGSQKTGSKQSEFTFGSHFQSYFRNN